MLGLEGKPWWFPGPGAALLTLALWRDIQVSTAVGLLVAAAGLQAFAYAGFHSYAQDVCPKVCPLCSLYLVHSSCLPASAGDRDVFCERSRTAMHTKLSESVQLMSLRLRTTFLVPLYLRMHKRGSLPSGCLCGTPS